MPKVGSKRLQLGLMMAYTFLFGAIIDASCGHDVAHYTVFNRNYAHGVAFASFQRPSITTDTIINSKGNKRKRRNSSFHYKDQSLEDEHSHLPVVDSPQNKTDAPMDAFRFRTKDGENQPLSQPKNHHSNRSKTNIRNENSRNRKYKTRAGRQHQKSQKQVRRYRSSFTEFQIAPALELVDPPTTLSDSQTFDRNQIYSPVVLKHTREECVDYICGPLAVTYTNNDGSIRRWLEENIYATGIDTESNQRYKFVGVDVEAVPNVQWREYDPFFANRPATVQLSTPTSALVIHLTQEITLTSLQKVLADPQILKVGVAINDDMLELYRWNQNYDSKGRLDLSGIGSTSQMVSLQKLVRAIVGVELPKSKKTAMSDWSRVPLSERQLTYASRDAWAGAAIMENLNLLFPSMNVEVLGDLVHDRERDMEDIDIRRRLRKGAKTKVKDVMRQFKKYVNHSSKHKQLYLPSIMPLLIKEEIERLKTVMDENAPDSIQYFEAESRGLDFSFEDPEGE